MVRNLPELAGVVQRNCDISDARHAGEYGLCTFLLKMREYYRWEHELPFARSLPKDALGEWLKSREEAWGGIEQEPFAPLPLARGALEPFDVQAANRELLPQGAVYGAGYGRFAKPVFFLGELERIEERAGLRIVVSSCEHARELAAPPAMLQGRTVFVRLESVRRYLWEKLEEWQWRKQGGAVARALAGYDFVADPERALGRMAANEAESMILHEIGEARAGEALGEAWAAMALEVSGTRAEIAMRAVRDLLADCLSTLPVLAERGNAPALHFHFATFDAPRRQMFPQALEAYEAYAERADAAALRRVAREGAERWLEAARGLLALSPAARAPALEALLPPSAR